MRLMQIMVIAVLMTAGAARDADAKITWARDLGDALRKSKSEKKAVLLIFDAMWCGWCDKLDEETLTNDRLQKYISSNLIPVRLDYDIAMKERDDYNINGVPATLVLDANGEVLGKASGFLDAEPFLNTIIRADKLTRDREILDVQRVAVDLINTRLARVGELMKEFAEENDNSKEAQDERRKLSREKKSLAQRRDDIQKGFWTPDDMTLYGRIEPKGKNGWVIMSDDEPYIVAKSHADIWHSKLSIQKRVKFTVYNLMTINEKEYV